VNHLSQDDGVLAKTQVLDATPMLAGPFAAPLVGDLSADELKIESLHARVQQDPRLRRHTVDGVVATLVAVNDKGSVADDFRVEGERGA